MKQIFIFTIACILCSGCVFAPRAGDPIIGKQYQAAIRPSGLIVLDDDPNDAYFLAVTHLHSEELTKVRGGTHYGVKTYHDSDGEFAAWFTDILTKHPGLSQATLNYLYKRGVHIAYPGSILIETGKKNKFRPELDLLSNGGRDKFGDVLRMKLIGDGTAVVEEIYDVVDWGYVVDPRAPDGLVVNMVPFEREEISDYDDFIHRYEKR